MSNSFGTLFRLTSFGESHGTAVGGIIDGCPSGIYIDVEFIQQALNRRRPGQSNIASSRNEPDQVTFLSGIFNGISTGAPIAFMVQNTNQNTSDYEHLKETFRPSHADFTYQCKYGIRDYRGGGRASARESIARVVAGAVAQLILRKLKVKITAYVSQLGDIKLNQKYHEVNLDAVDTNPMRCPDPTIALQMEQRIMQLKQEGDTIGGVVSCIIKGVPVGWGEPIYGKLQAMLAQAMLTINAAKGFDYGSGFDDIHLPGSQLNDPFVINDGQITTASNNSGGIQGGISNGADIYFRVAFKPIPTLFKPQQTVNSANQPHTLSAHGRHDTTALPRAVPIVEAMAAIVLADAYLLSLTNTNI